jgi:CubicO group peptidase (beta-lactamase class C family)
MTGVIDQVLHAAVARGDVPGVVAMAADDDGVVYEGAAGERATDASDPITPDTMMRIASMTKMVTTVAALQLSEQGALELDAPVDTYRPEFADLQVLEGFDGDTPVLRPPATRATVRQLMSHTTGLAYWFLDANIDRYEQVTGTPNILPGSLAALAAPLMFDPGTRFEYGINHDYLILQRMLLGHGSFDNTRILDPASVAAAFTNQIGDLYFPAEIPTAHPELSADVNLGPDLKWGLGLLLNETQQPGMRAVGSGAWAGLLNTYFWVDPTSRLTAAIYSQLLPFAEPSALELYADFERALYASRPSGR